MQGTKLSLKVADGSSVDDGGKKSGMVADAGGGQSDVADDDYDLWCAGLLAQRLKWDERKRIIFNTFEIAIKILFVCALLAIINSRNQFPEGVLSLGLELTDNILWLLLAPYLFLAAIVTIGILYLVKIGKIKQRATKVTSYIVCLFTLPVLLMMIIDPLRMRYISLDQMSQFEKIKLAYSLVYDSYETKLEHKLLDKIANHTDSKSPQPQSYVLYANFLLLKNACNAQDQTEIKLYRDRVNNLLKETGPLPALTLKIFKSIHNLNKDMVAQFAAELQSKEASSQ